MAGKCYRPDEILHLDGNEPHLTRCPTCRSLFDRGQSFLGEVRRASGPAAAAGESWKHAQAARARVEHFRALAPEARDAFLKDDPAPTPELALACCEQSRNALLDSPKEAQGWLEAAERILDRIPPADNDWRKRDLRWAEARVMATRGNLLMIRGHIRQAHALLEEARQVYEELGEQFQAALAARSLSFTFSKAGRLGEARSACLGSLRVLAEYGARAECHQVMNNLALVWMAFSEYRKAGLIFDHLLKHLDPAHPYSFLVARNAILPLMEQRHWEAALRKADAVSGGLDAVEHPVEKGCAIRLKGEILLLMGRAHDALDSIRTAGALLAPQRVGYESAQVDALTGQAHLALGQRGQADAAFRKARQFYADEGFALDLVDLMDRWARAAEEGASGEREFRDFRRYWQFGPAPKGPVSDSSRIT